jgi:hypothetical protein
MKSYCNCIGSRARTSSLRPTIRAHLVLQEVKHLKILQDIYLKILIIMILNKYY